MFIDVGYHLTKNQLHQTFITLFKQWSISVKIMPLGIVNGVANILNVGHTEDRDEYGKRTPSIYLKDAMTSLEIETALSGKPRYRIPNSTPLPINEWTLVELSQLRKSDGVYQFTVRIADTIFHQMDNTDPREFSDVEVYTGKSHVLANAKIANLTINTCPDCDLITTTIETTTTKQGTYSTQVIKR